MGKIEFEIDNQQYTIFIHEEFLLKINGLAGKLEYGGYMFASKIKDTNEFIVELLTDPHKKDVCSETFIKISNKHKKIARNIQKNNKHLYEIGFYHTHPENYGCRPSMYDLKYFEMISKKYKISLFVIGVTNKVNIIVYSQGNKIKEEVI